MSRSENTSKLIQAALFTAITAVGAFISVPLPFTPIPVTLATLAAMLAGTLLGPRYGSLSQIVYLLLGAVGLPVFHNFTGGLGILTGPTGGFLLGYVAMALISGVAVTSKRGNLICTLAIATVTCYIVGTAWFMATTGSGASAAFVSCIAPFIPGDIIKIIAAVILTERLKLYIRR